MEELIDKIQDSTNQRWEIIEATIEVTMDLIEQHIVQSTRFHTMIQVFMVTLYKDMQVLEYNKSMHVVSL